MTGKWVVGMIVGMAALAGAAMWYLQVHYYYDRLEPAQVEISLTGIVSGAPEPIPATEVQAIDATSSPIRFRACFATPLSLATLTETYAPYETAEPLVAPDWFGCFDATEVGAALEEGRALAFLGTRDITYGIDRVVAVTENGRGFAWHQINHCGEKVFDGEPVPEGCPPPPEE